MSKRTRKKPGRIRPKAHDLEVRRAAQADILIDLLSEVERYMAGGTEMIPYWKGDPFVSVKRIHELIAERNPNGPALPSPQVASWDKDYLRPADHDERLAEAMRGVFIDPEGIGGGPRGLGANWFNEFRETPDGPVIEGARHDEALLDGPVFVTGRRAHSERCRRTASEAGTALRKMLLGEKFANDPLEHPDGDRTILSSWVEFEIQAVVKINTWAVLGVGCWEIDHTDAGDGEPFQKKEVLFCCPTERDAQIAVYYLNQWGTTDAM